MRLYGVTTACNVEPYVPYVMKYVEALGYDRFIVYDNCSTDRTVELLKEYPFVEVRTFGEGGFSEDLKTEMIMNAYMEFFTYHWQNYGGKDFAWMTATDFDDVIYLAHTEYDGVFKHYMSHITWHGYNVVNEPIVNLLPPSNGRSLPKDDFAHLYVDKIGKGIEVEWQKPILFRLDTLSSLKLEWGQHRGHFYFNDGGVKTYNNSCDLMVFHLKYALGEFGVNRGDDNFTGHGIPRHSHLAYQLRDSIDMKDYMTYKFLHGRCPYESADELKEKI